MSNPIAVEKESGSGATPSAKKSDDGKKGASKREKLIRPRGKRGGVKNRKSKDAKIKDDDVKAKVKAKGKAKADVKKDAIKTGVAEESTEEKTDHSLKIASFHTLLKRIAQTKDPKEKLKLHKELLEEHGGLDAYQKESLKGRDRLNAGETGKWLSEQLAEPWKLKQEKHGQRKLRLLDVGALSGTAYAKYPWIEPCYIDLNPQNSNVVKSDFFDFPIPASDSIEKYDCVSLSLVANFEGDLVRRGEMLIHAHSYLGPRGWMYLVLPLACVSNSRYLDHDHLRKMLDACGWSIVTQSDSKRLTRWLCQRKQPRKGKEASWDGTIFKKTEIRKGPSFNNFCIRVRGAEPSSPAEIQT